MLQTTRNLFGIESNFVEDNPSSVRNYEAGSLINYDNEIKLYTNDRAGKAGRAKWFIANKDIITSNIDLIGEWQVVVSSANAGGQMRNNQLEIIDNHSAIGRTRVSLASFKTQKEAKNFYKYVQSFLIRFMFLMTEENLSSLGKKVPDIGDYSDANQLIDFTLDVNQQLYKLIGLNDEEVLYVVSLIKDLNRNPKK